MWSFAALASCAGSGWWVSGGGVVVRVVVLAALLLVALVECAVIGGNHVVAVMHSRVSGLKYQLCFSQWLRPGWWRMSCSDVGVFIVVAGAVVVKKTPNQSLKRTPLTPLRGMKGSRAARAAA